MSIPLTHVVEGLKLTSEAFVDLIEITTIDAGIVRFKNNGSGQWNSYTWEHLPYTLTGVEAHANEQEGRPTLTVVNPDNIFSSFVAQGDLDKATVKRYRLLKTDFLNNISVYQQKSWFVSRITNMNRDSITMELRELIDGPNFLLPARRFIPPEFPMVSIS